MVSYASCKSDDGARDPGGAFDRNPDPGRPGFFSKPAKGRGAIQRLAKNQKLLRNGRFPGTDNIRVQSGAARGYVVPDERQCAQTQAGCRKQQGLRGEVDADS